MSGHVVSRPVEIREVATFLDSAVAEPSALVVEGEPGMGKTTLWLTATQAAGERGFQTLAARPAAAESVLAYTSLADMLGHVDASAFAELPATQRSALERVLLCDNGKGGTDQRAVAAGFLSLVKGLADEAPVLLAIDDLHWLDSASMFVVAFVARRLAGGIGVLCTIRTDPDGGNPASWLQLPAPDAIRRIGLTPLGLGGLRELVSTRLGRTLSRPTLVWIQEVSRGNPFYALELARVVDDERARSDMRLPTTLTELVRTRIETLDTEVKDALLAASCVAAPTVELVARATGADAERVAGLLTDAEDRGIVGIDGHRLCFTHPLLARGVYDDAPTAQRRAMHRRLAEIVDEPELQARHLAKAVAWGDPHTLESLDSAAAVARLRGAPTAAAELIDLAIGLGGDTDERRIQSASHHFDAGDFRQAREQLEKTVDHMAPGTLRAGALGMLARMNLLDGCFGETASLSERALAEAEGNPALVLPMMVTLAMALFNLGRRREATETIEEAVEDGMRLGHPHLLSQALTMREMLRLIGGGGLDEASMRRALELEDRQAATPVIFQASTQSALFLAWTGRLEEAREQMQLVRRRCIERGEESELVFVSVHGMLIEIWRGDLAAAGAIAEDAMERAEQLDGEGLLSVALTIRAAVSAYVGRVDEARRDANDAQAASGRSYSYILAALPSAILGFLDVSLGNYEEALTALEPCVRSLRAAPEGTEIYAAGFVPDLVEALVHVGRLDEAEWLVAALESNGRRLDRAWMLAVGLRCRAMLLAARCDLDAASRALQRAMAVHERLAMPFERARTQLLLGQVQRRHRHRDSATETLSQALATFATMGAKLWADRARDELARTNVAPGGAVELSPTEQRVAELAASGMTNRDVAAALFVSPKTVEANLARIYRKLSIHSRAELGRAMNESEA